MQEQQKFFTEVKTDFENENLRHIDAFYDDDDNSEGVCIRTVHEETKAFTLGTYAKPNMLFDPLLLEVLRELGAKF